MAFIGRDPYFGSFNTQTITGSTASSFTLDYLKADSASALAFKNGTLLTEGNGISSWVGTTLTLDAALIVTDQLFVIWLGHPYDVPEVADNSIDEAQLSPAVTNLFRKWQAVNNTVVNAEVNYYYLVDTSVAPTSFVLPANPSSGSTIKIVDASGTSSVNPITVTSPDANVQHGSSLLLQVDRIALELVFAGANGWVVTDNHTFL